MLAGFTNRDLAKKISVRWKTVEFHLDNLYAKPGVRTRMLGAKPREIPSYLTGMNASIMQAA
jgi:hypothetical protein